MVRLLKSCLFKEDPTMKKLFQEPEVDLLKFSVTDVITSSPNDDLDLDPNETPRL